MSVEVLLLLVTQRMQAVLMILPSCPAQKAETPLVKPRVISRVSNQETISKQVSYSQISVYIFHCVIPLRHLPPAPCASQKPYQVKMLTYCLL